MKDLMPLQDYLADARARHYALGGFCLWTYAYGMAIAEVAQKLNLPMLYIIGDAEVKFFGGEKNAVAAARTIAENVDVPVILPLRDDRRLLLSLRGECGAHRPRGGVRSQGRRVRRG